MIIESPTISGSADISGSLNLNGSGVATTPSAIAYSIALS